VHPENLKVWLYGAGGIGVVALDILSESKIPVAGFLDDSENLQEFNGFRVLRADTFSEMNSDDFLVVCISDVDIRKKLCLKYEDRLRTVTHRSAVISPTASIGKGVLCFHRSVVQANARIGSGVILNTACSIDHDCRIGSFAHIGPQATICGLVDIGERAYIGANATVLPNVIIGSGAVIGAGAVVTKDVAGGVTVVGVPARVV